jgi:diguanylate cyclase (GGDEF)-like protein
MRAVETNNSMGGDVREIMDRGQRAWLLFLFGGILATAGYFLLPSATIQNVFDVLIDLCVVAAIVAGVFMHQPNHALAWYLFAIGMALVAAGDALWAIDFLGIEYPYPSLADVLYIGSIPFFVGGLLLIGRGGIGGKGVNLIDPLIVAVGTGMLLWVLFMEPGLHGYTPSLLERLLSIVYLAAYVVMTAILLRPLFVPEKRSPALYLLCGSLAAFFIGDLAFGSLTTGSYEAYEAGNLVYAGYLLGSALIGAAALHPSMVRLCESVSEAPTKLAWWRLALLTGATLLAPCVLTVEALLGRPIDVLLIVGGSAVLFLLVALRMASMISERMILERRLEFQAFHDPLTHLPNRSLFTDRFERALARTERQGGRVAVLFVDLDDFKEVNDSLGHETGDRMLVAVAHRLRACLRPTDTAARLGGDEFTVLLEDVEHVQGAVRVAKRVLGELRRPVTLEELETVIEASIGIALGDGAHDRQGELLRKADLALYWAKNGGKSSYEVFDPGLEEKINL